MSNIHCRWKYRFCFGCIPTTWFALNNKLSLLWAFSMGGGGKQDVNIVSQKDWSSYICMLEKSPKSTATCEEVHWAGLEYSLHLVVHLISTRSSRAPFLISRSMKTFAPSCGVWDYTRCLCMNSWTKPLAYTSNVLWLSLASRFSNKQKHYFLTIKILDIQYHPGLKNRHFLKIRLRWPVIINSYSIFYLAV